MTRWLVSDRYCKVLYKSFQNLSLSVKFSCFFFQSNDSDVDLIKLDVSSPTLEDFDPLKFRDKKDEIEKKNTTTDSALLHEYGLDFSQFRLDNFRSNLSCDQDVSFN